MSTASTNNATAQIAVLSDESLKEAILSDIRGNAQTYRSQAVSGLLSAHGSFSSTGSSSVGSSPLELVMEDFLEEPDADACVLEAQYQDELSNCEVTEGTSSVDRNSGMFNVGVVASWLERSGDELSDDELFRPRGGQTQTSHCAPGSPFQPNKPQYPQPAPQPQPQPQPKGKGKQHYGYKQASHGTQWWM